MIRENDNFIFPGLGKATSGIVCVAYHRPVFQYFFASILLNTKEFFSEIAIFDEGGGLLA
jgi:hypothetical protein